MTTALTFNAAEPAIEAIARAIAELQVAAGLTPTAMIYEGSQPNNASLASAVRQLQASAGLTSIGARVLFNGAEPDINTLARAIAELQAAGAGGAALGPFDFHVIWGDSQSVGQAGSQEISIGLYSGTWYAPVNEKIYELATFQTRTITKGSGTINAGTVNPVVTESSLVGNYGDVVQIVQSDASIFTGTVIGRNAATPSITVSGTTTASIIVGATITVTPRNTLGGVVASASDTLTNPISNYYPLSNVAPLPNVVTPPSTVCALLTVANLAVGSLAAGRKILLVNIGVPGSTCGASPGTWNPSAGYVPTNSFDYFTGLTTSGAAFNFGVAQVLNALSSNPGNVLKSIICNIGTNDAIGANTIYTGLTRYAGVVNTLRTQAALLNATSAIAPFIIGPIRQSVVDNNPGATQGPCVVEMQRRLQFFLPYTYTIRPLPAYINDPHNTNGTGFNGSFDDSVHWSAPNTVGWGQSASAGLPTAAARTPASSDAVDAATLLSGASSSVAINDATIAFTPAANAGYYKVELRTTSGPGPYVDYTTNSGYAGELLTGGGTTAENYISVLLPSTGYDIRVTSFNYTLAQTNAVTASFTTGTQQALPLTNSFTAQLLYEEASVATLADTSGTSTGISNSNTAGKLSLVTIGGARGKVLSAATGTRTSAASQVRINHTGLAVSNNATICTWFSCPHSDSQIDWIMSNRTLTLSGLYMLIDVAGYLVAGYGGVQYLQSPSLFPTSASGANHHVGVIANLNTSNAAFTARTLYLMLDNVMIASATIPGATSWLPGADQTVVGSPFTGATGTNANCIGQFDDTRVYYNAALTFAQFDSVYQGHVT